MDIKIRPYLRRDKIRADGKAPLYIRLTRNRRWTYVSTGIYLKPDEWNMRTQEIRRVHPNHRRLNQHLADEIRKIEETYYEQAKKGVPSVTGLKEASTAKQNKTLLKSLEEYIETAKEDGRFWEMKRAKNLLVDMKSFRNLEKHDINLSNVDSQFVEQFQRHLLRSVGNAPNTVARKMRVFRAMVNDLRMKGDLTRNPFELVKSVTERSAEKTKLTPDQIDAIIALELEERSPIWHSRNYFMYSFYNAGIRFGDLCCLRWRNIVDGRLVYTMNKTGDQKSIFQSPLHLEILEYYKTIHLEPDGYIFPLLNSQADSPLAIRSQISSRNVVVNKHLKKMATMAGIQSNISFHVSRHSFSQYALRKGLDVYTISKMLGHRDLKTTQEYLSHFDEVLVDQSMKKLFGDDN